MFVSYFICLFVNQKPADYMRIRDWSADFCSSDLTARMSIAPKTSRSGISLTENPLLTEGASNPSASRTEKALRTGVRDTPSRLAICSAARCVPGGSSPVTINSRLRVSTVDVNRVCGPSATSAVLALRWGRMACVSIQRARHAHDTFQMKLTD